MVDVAIFDHLCPWCGRKNQAAAGTGQPGEGDWLVCWSCRLASVAVLTPYGLSARMPTWDERKQMRHDPVLQATQDGHDGSRPADRRGPAGRKEDSWH